MATLIIEDIDDDLYKKLSAQAKQNNRSVSKEIVAIIEDRMNHPRLSAQKATEEFLALAGSWKDERPAEEIVADINKSRRSGRRSKRMKLFSVIFVIIGMFLFCSMNLFAADEVVLLNEEFDSLSPGMFSPGVVGAHAEYHYLRDTAPKEGWVVSCFTWNVGSQRAWRVIRENGDTMMQQVYHSPKGAHTHPMVVTGSEFWGDYAITCKFAPDASEQQSGIVFRYRNDRCYYFFGVDAGKVVLKLVNHATAYRKPYEKILDDEVFTPVLGEFLFAEIQAKGSSLTAKLNNQIVLEANDSTFSCGKVGLMADCPARYSSIKVTATAEEKDRIESVIREKKIEEQRLQESNPKPVVWKKMKMDDYGVGRNLRFGDLNGDGEIDVLFGQVLHHGPKDRNSELSCLTAVTFDGDILWQIGQPDPWKDHLTNDVGFQIHDFDGDGNNEVVYCMNQEIIVADGSTGKTKFKAPTPKTPAEYEGPHNIFPRILGDCLFFCDFRGIGRDADLVIKDRYRYFWVYNDQLELMWKGECNTGHYPYAYDVDSDGRDELMIGYSLYDDDGDLHWTLDDKIDDHADGVAIAQMRDDQEPRLLCAASDEGIFFTDMKGNVLKHHYFGHVQNPATANLRDDLTGLESVSINFWGNQGLIHYFDADGNLYHDFEPCQHGSMCLPINYTGESEEFFVLSPNVEEGGMYDGWGRRVVNFPADGHPELCNAVLDITGDCRDEVVVWDTYELWVYTQDDNPKKGKLYKPIRNPLYNYSNYQATVSFPNWSQ